MSIPFVIDEWIFHDLSGQNEEDGPKQEETFRFVFKLLKSKDKVVILKGSPFEKKLWQFIKESNKDPVLSVIGSALNKGIMINASKTITLEEENLKAVPPELWKLIPLDDQYLFLAHLNVKGSIIITTDGRWHKKIMKNKSIKIIMRDSFIKDYLKS